ncbi:MAG: sigma-70 family RNA polymerase sigma factor [Clostridia bacterium]|nr:sigma-70 family RNA polymerase sigma factor [Clostridia bacterium]
MRLPLEMLIEKYQKNLFAAALNICANYDDAQDAVQETFLQYYLSDKEFNDEEHLKAWLLRVAINKAKDLSRSLFRRRCVPLEELGEDIPFEDPADGRLFEEVMRLPEKYRIVIHLFYYEDLPVKEIAALLHTGESSVKMRLSRGRDLLKTILTEESDNDKSGTIQAYI